MKKGDKKNQEKPSEDAQCLFFIKISYINIVISNSRRFVILVLFVQKMYREKIKLKRVDYYL